MGRGEPEKERGIEEKLGFPALRLVCLREEGQLQKRQGRLYQRVCWRWLIIGFALAEPARIAPYRMDLEAESR